MATRVVMPKLTDTMEEGVVIDWKKREGEDVAAGDVLAEIETDKAVMDLEAFGSGRLRKVLAAPGQTVKSGALIAVIAEPDEDIQAVLKDSGGVPAAAPTVRKTEPDTRRESPVETTEGRTKAEGEVPARQRRDAAGEPPGASAEGRAPIKVSPRAKRVAMERGVDLATVVGTGPDGRIIEEDVLKAARRDRQTATIKPRPSLQAGDLPLSQMRKAIALATTQSKAPVPHFYLTIEINMEQAEHLRGQFKQSRRTHPSVTDLLIKAAALALMRHPEINVSYTGESIRRHGSIDIGVAVGLDNGLITPVLRDCGAKSLEQIAKESRPLIERARQRRLDPQEYMGATFTVSNLGMYDVENFIAVLMPPEAAAIAVGAVRDVPVVEKGTLKAGRRMKVTMSCDHRALDGLQAAQFLNEFKRVLEHPLELILPKEST